MPLDGITLDDYQDDVVDFMLDTKGCGVFLDQGTGKTIVTLESIDRLYRQGYNVKALVICLKVSVYATWRSAIDTLCPHLTNHIQVLHYEAAVSQRHQLKKEKFNIVAIDECQRIGKRSGASSRMAKMLNGAEYKWALSGTPMDGDKEETNPIALWAIFRFFAPEVFGAEWKYFENEYIRKIRFMKITKGNRDFFVHKERFKQHMLPKFQRIASQYIIRVSRSVLGLQKMLIQPMAVNMTPREKRTYKILLRDKIYKDERIVASVKLAVTAIVKAQQVTSGFIRDDNGEDHRLGTISSKEIMSRALLNRHRGEQIVIFCRFIPDMHRMAELCERMGYTHKLLWKKTKNVEEVKNAFLAGEFDVLISQIKKGGASLDLYSASVCIVYSLTFSWIDWEQLKARLHRRGQERRVRIYPLIARHSIDEHIWQVLMSKNRLNKGLLIHFKRSKRAMAKKAVRKTATKKKAAKKTATKKTTTKKTENKDKPFGVAELADELDITTTYARDRLRAAGVEKNGGKYAWNKREFDEAKKAVAGKMKKAA